MAFNQLTSFQPRATPLFADMTLVETFFLPYALSIVYYLSGTDIAEWGEAFGASVKALLAPVHRQRFQFAALFLILILIAGLVLADLFNRLGYNLLEPKTAYTTIPSLSVALTVLLLIVACVGVANINSTWSSQLSPGSLFAGALFLFCAFRLVPVLGILFLSANGQTNTSIGADLRIGTALVLVAGLVLGLARLLARRGAAAVPGRESGRESAFLITVIALIALPVGGQSALAVLGLHVPSPANYFDALQLMMTIGAVLYAVSMVFRTHASPSGISPLSHALRLIISFQVIHWALNAPAYLARFGLETGAVASVIFLLAIVWDVLMSGKDTTSSDSPEHVLQARVTLYLSYTLVATTTLLFLASTRVATTQAAYNPSDVLNTFGALNNFGLLYLGVPAIMSTFLLRAFNERVAQVSMPIQAQESGAVLARRHGTPVRARTTTKRVAAPSRTSVIALVGALILLLLAAALDRLFALALRLVPIAILFALAYAFAFVNYGTAQAYSTHMPGPGCDPDPRPVWTYSNGAEYSCQEDGLRLAAPSDRSWVAIGYFTPSTFFPDEYAVQVSADLSNLSHGCVAVLTHYAEGERYLTYIESFVCLDGKFGIYYCDGSSGICSPIAQGDVPLSSTYTLATALRNTDATLVLNGIGISGHVARNSSTDAVYLFLTGRPNELVGHPVKDIPVGYAVFSDFSFAPMK